MERNSSPGQGRCSDARRWDTARNLARTYSERGHPRQSNRGGSIRPNRRALHFEEVLFALKERRLVVTRHAVEGIRDEGLAVAEVIWAIPRCRSSFPGFDMTRKSARRSVVLELYGRQYLAVLASDEGSHDITMVTFTIHTRQHYLERGMGYPDVDGTTVFEFGDESDKLRQRSSLARDERQPHSNRWGRTDG